MKTNIKEKKPRIAFIKPLEANYLYETSSTELVDLLESSGGHTGPLAFFTDYNTDIYLTKLPYSPECQSWGEGLYMGTNGHKAVQQRRLCAKQNKKQLELSDVEQIKWSDYQVVISIGCAVPSQITKQYPEIVWCYYIPDPTPAFFLSKKWGPLHNYNVFLTQGISAKILSEKEVQTYRETKRIVLDIPFVFMRPDTFTKLFPTDNRNGIRIESRSRKDANPEIIKTLTKFGPIAERIESVKEYTEQLASTRYFIILDTPYERFRGNALVEANAAGCLIIAPDNLRSLNSHLIPEENRYQSYTELFELLTKLNQSESIRNEMLENQNAIIAKASYITPKNAFDKIVTSHAESEAVNIKQNIWKQRYFPIICTRLMPIFGILNSLTTKLTKKPLFEYIAKIINKKGDMF